MTSTGQPDIWDLYQQMQPGGWTPPAGIEGSPGGGFSTSGNQAWQNAHNPQPSNPQPDNPQPPSGPASMPAWAQGIANWAQGVKGQFQNQGGNMAQRKTYFPNTGAGNQQFPMAPGVAEGQARMNQLAQTGTYASRRDDFRNKYPQFVNPVAQQNLQNFDLAQAYNTGYGAPTPTIQQGAGGPYRVAGGVANPISFPNVFQRFGSDLSTGLGLMAKGAGAIGSFAANQFGNLFNRPQPAQPSYADTRPRRYFDY